MKIACVDKTAADRLKLEQYLDEAFTSHRGVVGHLPQASYFRPSLEELVYGSRPEMLVIGPAFSVEEAFSACRLFRETFPNLPIVLLFSASNYSLRTIRRFERFTKALFSNEEPSARLIHTLFELRGDHARPPRGKLVVVSGVKGGVGASSYIAGLMHAAQSTSGGNLKAVVVDLSSSAALLHYMGTDRSHAPEYATILSDGIRPQRDLVERLIIEAPNGISLLLQPAGGRDIRELWLRDVKRFELTLQVIELLLELHDLVIVDIASVEGILSFALQSQADIRLLFSSNEPASVHLLQKKLEELADIPGDATLAVGIHSVLPSGLTSRDIFDFILPSLQPEETLTREASATSANRPILQLSCLPHDAKARHWIGTGNTIYTEGGRALQKALDENFLALSETLFGSTFEPPSIKTPPSNTIQPGKIAKKIQPAIRRRLPWLGSSTEAPETKNTPHFQPNHAKMRPAGLDPEGEPQHERGSSYLEYVLFLAGALIVAAVALPSFYQGVAAYLIHFTEGGPT